jgi:hypothetical protein
MSDFIDSLKLEMKMVYKFNEPKWPIKDGETVVVEEIPDPLKAIWTVAMSTSRQAGLFAIDQQCEGDDKTAQIEELKSKAYAIESIFWVYVKDEFKLWGIPDSVGIRKGWKVVTFKPRSMAHFFPFGPIVFLRK